MADPLADPRYSVEHAKRRLQEFEAEVAAFGDTHPYASVVETNDNGTEDTYKLKLVKPMPVGLPGIASDILNSLRSSLDQAGYAVAVAAGKSGDDAHFPFDENAAIPYGRGKGRSRDLPKEIFDLMVACKPHKTGNTVLWAINKMCNAHKHEVVVAVPLGVGGMHIKNLHFRGTQYAFFAPNWDTSRNEMKICAVNHGATVKYDLQIATFVAIGDIEGIRHQPAVPVFNQMASEVDRILMAVEAEARRIGLFV